VRERISEEKKKKKMSQSWHLPVGREHFLMYCESGFGINHFDIIETDYFDMVNMKFDVCMNKPKVLSVVPIIPKLLIPKKVIRNKTPESSPRKSHIPSIVLRNRAVQRIEFPKKKKKRKKRKKKRRQVRTESSQKICCIIGCENEVKNRLFGSLKTGLFCQKWYYKAKKWDKICHHHYFSDLYQSKKKWI
jgi:hypothetical protein